MALRAESPRLLEPDPAVVGEMQLVAMIRVVAVETPGGSVHQREIVVLVLEGHPSATIAKRLGIGRGTVKNHRRRLYDKLDITTERELFLRYLEWLTQSDPVTATATL